MKMKNMTGWVPAAAVITILGACTVEVTDGSPDGGSTSGSASSTSSGAAGAAGSSTSTSSSGTGGSGTGGAGGSSFDGGACVQSATPSACERCAFEKCMTETCTCKSNAGCGPNFNTFLTCVSGSTAFDTCATTFLSDSNGEPGGGDAVNNLGICFDQNGCEDRCKGRDGGIRRK
jgi:hypothetical protein